MWDSIIVVVIVATAALWLAARIRRSWRAAIQGQGSGCAGCGKQNSCAAITMAARLNDQSRSRSDG